MVNTLVLVNEISPTSIPFETSVQIAAQEACDITVASFYDEVGTQQVEAEVSINVRCLGADSRFDPVAWRRFFRELRTGGYDVLHTHHNFTGSVARVMASVSDLAIVDTEHRQHSSYTALQNGVNAPTLPLADRVVFNSEATQNSLRWYERRLLDDEQLSIVYNGVDLENLRSIMGAVDEDSTGPSVLSVGRLVPVKNHKTLLEAFALVREQMPEATLLLIGDGPLRAILEARTVELGIDDAVQFKGEISRAEVFRELACADLFTIPSQAEGFCVAAVEAMGAGLPVVVSDISVFHEVVGEPGVFADPNDHTAFAEAIGGLLERPERRSELGSEGRARVNEQFSLERTAREYYTIYKEVAKTGG